MLRNHASSFFAFISVSALGLALVTPPASAQDPCLESLPPIADGAFAGSVSTGDLDGDGDQDVVLVQSGAIHVFSNDGNGTFAGSPVHAVANAFGTAIGDLDGDSDRDIAFLNPASETFNVLLNQGGGVFAFAGSTAAGDSPVDFELGDLDGDGDLDFAVVNHVDLTLSLGFNHGDGTFGDVVAYSTGPGKGSASMPISREVELGDVDGDGDLDLVSQVTPFFSGSEDFITVRKNSGGGVFGALELTPHEPGPFSLALDDFDNDGDLDLAVGNDFPLTVQVYLNPGDGSFTTPGGPYQIFDTAYSLASGDLDADGDADLVAGAGSASRMLFNNGAGAFTVAPESFDATGTSAVVLSNLRDDSRPEILRPRDAAVGVAVFRSCQTLGSGRYCFGDGSSGVACPCQNPGQTQRGCANILYAQGAQLSATGNSSVSNDTLVLKSTGMSGAQSWYFQATGQDAVPFGRGILCVGGALLRVGQKSVVGGSSTNPSGADFPLHVKGAIPPAGGTRYYQVSYRHANPVCTPAPVSNTNRTNGLAIVWTP